MSAALMIANDEWRLWLRSRLAICVLAAFAVLLVVASWLSAQKISHADHQRSAQQAAAEESFLSQPARHPHRMVHYGHYAFRTPPPLAIVDPGVDAVTGQSIFLEGHRQNTAMFADARASADVGGFGALTPAFIYQTLLPLLLIAIGHGVLLREREARTLGPLLAQGLSGQKLYAGKALALLGAAGIMLVPLLVTCLVSLANGEVVGAGFGLVSLYALYALVWCALVMLVSALVRSRGLALGILVLIWLASVLIVPRLAVASASAAVPSEGKIETDLRMQADMRELGDGHNSTDPAFNQLRSNLLAEYNVDRVEDLPVNYRGIVAQNAEADLTDLMNRYADERMTIEQRQSRHASAFGWLSPMMALASGSRAIAGTDLATHHRFLEETEQLRFDFVQGLNRVHAEQLDYSDDMNRSSDPDAERRTRVSAENWDLLNSFDFEPAGATERLDRAVPSFVILLAWLGVITAAGLFAASRIKP